MHHHARILSRMGTGMGIAIALLSVPSYAQACRLGKIVPPSPEMNTFQSEELGLSLEIPTNYRSILRNSGHITFHDPSTFEFIQCLTRTDQYGAVPPYVTLEVYQVGSPNSDLVQIVRRKRPWVDYYSPDYRPIEVQGYPAIQYEYTNEIYELPIANVSFLSEDGQTLFTLSGPAQHPILENALSTLEIVRSVP